MGQAESADPKRQETIRKFNILTLFTAAKDGNLEKVAKYLDFRDINVNSANQRGNTALHIASIHGRVDVVEFLLRKGADVNARCRHGYSPLYVAAMENHAQIVELLLAAGANKNLSPKGELKEMTALRVAEMQGHVDVARLLRDPGDDTPPEPG